MSKNKKEKENKGVEVLTIRDFKVMIEGMDMVLGENWYPTEEQWGRIRKKINNLIDSSDTRYRPNVVMPGDPVDNKVLLANFPEIPVASNIPIGEVPVPTGSALTPAQPIPVPEADAEKVHRPSEFV